MPSVPAQDPAVEPVWITEGIQPLLMHCDAFYISRAMWSRFHSPFPWVSFDEFWDVEMCLYDYHNDDSKSFWEEFGRDPEAQARILLERCARWVWHRAEAPKEEPAEEIPREPCFRFHLRNGSVEDDH